MLPISDFPTHTFYRSLDFAENLFLGLRTIFREFGKERITKSSHLEKLCLISPLVGRDKISDFTTNFAKKYLLDYTMAFARENLSPSQCKTLCVPKVEFNYEPNIWPIIIPCRSARKRQRSRSYAVLIE